MLAPTAGGPGGEPDGGGIIEQEPSFPFFLAPKKYMGDYFITGAGDEVPGMGAAGRRGVPAEPQALDNGILLAVPGPAVSSLVRHCHHGSPCAG